MITNTTTQTVSELKNKCRGLNLHLLHNNMEISLDLLKEYITPEKFADLMIALEKINLQKLEEKKAKNRERVQASRAKKKKRSAKSKEDHEANVEVMEQVKEFIESQAMVYKACSRETTYAQCIRTWKEFTETAQKYNLSNIELCKRVVKASTMDKFRIWKVTNCKDLYQNYAKIINAYQVNKTKAVNSVWFLPGA